MTRDCSVCSGSGQARHAPCFGKDCAACRLLGSTPCGACEGAGKAGLSVLAPQDPTDERDRALRGLARARGSLESMRQLLVRSSQLRAPRQATVPLDGFLESLKEQGLVPREFLNRPLTNGQLLELVQEVLDETTAEALGLNHVQIDLLAEEEDAHVG